MTGSGCRSPGSGGRLEADRLIDNQKSLTRKQDQTPNAKHRIAERSVWNRSPDVLRSCGSVLGVCKAEAVSFTNSVFALSVPCLSELLGLRELFRDRIPFAINHV